MIKYVATIPSAAAKREVDGLLYVKSNLGLTTSRRITVKETDEVRMLRVDTVHPTNGTATIVIGRAGDAIADTMNLPFNVRAVLE